MPEISKPTSLNTIWADAGQKIKFEDSKIQLGYVAEIPTAQGFNWLQNRQDQFAAHVNQHGLPVWDNLTEYQALKSYTQGSDGNIYVAKVTNKGQDPVTDVAEQFWEEAFITVNGYVGGKRYIGYKVFSSDFTAVVNTSYFINSPLTVTFPVTANIGDAVVLAKRPTTSAILDVNGATVDLQSTSKVTYIYTSSGWIDVSAGNGSGEDVSLSGNTIVTQGTTETYTITDYNSFSLYSVSVNEGSATITGDTISLTVLNPTVSPQLTLTVIKDGVSSFFIIAVGVQSVTTPTILYPTEAQTSTEVSLTLSGSGFSTAPAGQDTHQSSLWQVSTNDDFTNIIFDSGVDTVNKTNITLPSGVLNINTQYYARVRYTGAIIGQSAFSATRSFTTTNKFVNVPTVSVSGGPSDVVETPALTTSAFSVFGGTDTHVSTDWQVVKVSDSSVVWESLGNTTNKVSINVPPSLLLENTQYKTRVRHAGASLGKSGWGEYTFTTRTEFFVFTPASVGLPYGGGLYSGANVIVSGVQYALIVPSKAQGGENTSVALYAGDTIVATTNNDGLTNTALLLATGLSPAATWADNLSINGYTDWYIPSKDEAEIIYRYLKPTTETNATTQNSPYNERNGVNPNSSPAGNQYTVTDPAQTVATDFKSGGTEALVFANYWTSTTDSHYPSSGSWYAFRPSNGDQSSQFGGATTSGLANRVRAVRRVAIPA